MKKAANKPVLFMLLISAALLLFFLIMQPLTILKFRDFIAVLFPKGIIGIKERNLLLIIQIIMLMIVIPVFIFTFIFSWRYRAGNSKATYDPDLVDNRIAEFVWWGLPLVATLSISILTWIKTEELDPFKPVEGNKKEMTIQVVALQWKWLFIYPQENIATVNFVQFPKEIPIRFEITADAPMNSFWIPDLGGQIYAMPNMKTQLNLIANEEGNFRGSSANLSGTGFATMHFMAKASSEEDFDQWVRSAQQSSKILSLETYKTLAAPSESHPVELYQLKDSSLFSQILNQYSKMPIAHGE